MSVGEVRVREGVLDDASVIAEHNRAMAMETESIYLDPDIALKGVQAALLDPALGTYYVVVRGQQIVGQLMINEEWLPLQNAFAWWIQSVYVKPDHRRNGYYRMLYRHVHEAARKQGVVAMKLYAYRDNVRAKQTYAQLGMHEEGAVYEYLIATSTGEGTEGKAQID